MDYMSIMQPVHTSNTEQLTQTRITKACDV